MADLSLRRLTPPDLAILAAVLLLVAASAAPSLRARAFRSLADRTAVQVDSVRSVSLRVRAETGSWPLPVEAGQAPEALRQSFPGDSAFAFDGFTLEWRVMEVVEYVETPAEPLPFVAGDAPPDSAVTERVAVVRPVGAIVVHSDRSALLAALLRRWEGPDSFVRDNTWTLLVDEPN